MIGIVTVFANIGSALGPIFMGAMFDSFGNYSAALEILGVLAVLCIIFTFIAYSKKNAKKIQDQMTVE